MEKMKSAVMLAIGFVLIFTGCNSNENPPEKEIPTIKDFVLTCGAEWDYNSIPWKTTLPNTDTVFVINTQAEFVKYFPTATSRPDNFTDYSLLFVYGTTANKIVETSHDLVPETDAAYRLNVDIEWAAEQTPDVWYVSILVPKIPGVSPIPYKKTQGQKPDAVEEIENFQTRLRIVEPKLISPKDVEYVWGANPKDIIMYYPPYHSYQGNIYFGYTDADGEILLCKVLNFPESAKQWEAEFVYIYGLGTVTETNVKINGTVRLYTDDKGEKYGTLELTSLEPTGPESDEPALQPGVYMETFPYPGNTRMDFIDGERVNITRNLNYSPELYEYKYEIGEHAVKFTYTNGTRGYETFFRVVSNSRIEMEYPYVITAERTGWQILTLERESDAGDYVLYKSCPCDDPNYQPSLLGLQVSGVEAYLFRDSIPREMEINFRLLASDFVCWIVIDGKTDDVWIYFNRHNVWNSAGDGKICNFPDHAKKIDIPINGCKVYIEGLMYTHTRIVIAPHITFDYILTKFKKE
jgi:hypothetical protein